VKHQLLMEQVLVAKHVCMTRNYEDQICIISESTSIKRALSAEAGPKFQVPSTCYRWKCGKFIVACNSRYQNLPYQLKFAGDSVVTNFKI